MRKALLFWIIFSAGAILVSQGSQWEAGIELGFPRLELGQDIGGNSQPYVRTWLNYTLPDFPLSIETWYLGTLWDRGGDWEGYRSDELGIDLGYQPQLHLGGDVRINIPLSLKSILYPFGVGHWSIRQWQEFSFGIGLPGYFLEPEIIFALRPSRETIEQRLQVDFGYKWDFGQNFGLDFQFEGNYLFGYKKQQHLDHSSSGVKAMSGKAFSSSFPV
jgi:hypothetical protein